MKIILTFSFSVVNHFLTLRRVLILLIGLTKIEKEKQNLALP
ncbi:hypothetical protein ATC1_131488 [Flexilinea flocculi]|uniref:Uncharacterized protein n=1 Tax=Flexilinea flocculi TaxID=1678840 RepID=A0A0S7BMA4_9CHLR|nr:hypothetical protein ATC1_131488 [Flexilinea flocculi]